MTESTFIGPGPVCGRVHFNFSLVTCVPKNIILGLVWANPQPLFGLLIMTDYDDTIKNTIYSD